MNSEDKQTLMRKTSTPHPSAIDVLGDDGRTAKQEYNATHHGGKVHQKNALGDQK
ncbi:MAG: hypothetical protein ABR985_22815 [Methanotrichaceae archaeon]|jgi:hypothetical protein